MRQVTVHTTISAPREQVFDFIADLAGRPAYTDHYLDDYRLARRIAATTRPDDPVYIYGGEPLVLFLADRRSPSKFVWNDPFVAGAYRGRFTHADLVRELERHPPVYFIVLRHDANMIDPVESIAHFRAAPELQAFVTRGYEERGWFGDFLLFERR